MDVRDRDPLRAITSGANDASQALYAGQSANRQYARPRVRMEAALELAGVLGTR